MSYSELLRETYPSLAPVIDDLFLLEAHQVAQLPERAPHSELAAVLHAYPRLRRLLAVRHPPIGDFLKRIMSRYGAVPEAELATASCTLLWEIADWIVYQRAPELYDEAPRVKWDVDGVTEVATLDGKVVIDAGAGTGRVAFAVAPLAQHVFAVEPVATLRAFIRKKAAAMQIGNLFVLDGLLDAIPMPESSADVLLTCQAIGWDLAAELAEIERVVKPDGMAMHTFGDPGISLTDNPLHEPLTAYGYESDLFEKGDIRMIRYWKRIGSNA